MKTSKPKTEPSAEASKLILILAGIFVVVAGLKLASDFFIPILLAFFFATISFPILNWLREHKVPRVFSVLITVLVDFAFIAGVVFVGIILVSDISSKWDSKYYAKTTERLDQLTEATSRFYNKWSPKTNSDEKAETAVRVEVPTKKADLVTENIESAENVLNWAKNIFEQLRSFLVTAFVVLLITVFMLSEARMFGRRIAECYEGYSEVSWH